MGQEAEGRGQGAGVGPFGKAEKHRKALRTQSRDTLSGRALQRKVCSQAALGGSETVGGESLQTPATSHIVAMYEGSLCPALCEEM